MTQKYRTYLALILAVFTVCAVPAFAQDTGASEAPIDISADTALEWDRANHRYIARGNARAEQGGTTLTADVLTAHYDPSDSGATALTEIHADTAVQIMYGDATVFGDKAVYDLTTEKAKVTGEILQMVSDDITVTADDYFEYDARAGTVTAYGNAAVRDGDKKLESARLIAYLIQNDAGETVVDRVEAPKIVTITTARETAVGSRGLYNVKSEIATLTGDVKITQGQNILEGGKAEVNMKTGKSRLFAAKDEQGLPGRVRGVFYPKPDSDTNGE